MLLDMRGRKFDLEPIGAMDDSTFAFYLTGSFYMNCADELSDVDFITQDSPEVRLWLRAIGFSGDVLEGPARYDVNVRGSQTNAVMQYDDFLMGRVIQVQLVKDIALQRTVRDVIDTHLLWQHIDADREERRDLWNALAEVLSFKPKGKRERAPKRCISSYLR